MVNWMQTFPHLSVGPKTEQISTSGLRSVSTSTHSWCIVEVWLLLYVKTSTLKSSICHVETGTLCYWQWHLFPRGSGQARPIVHSPGMLLWELRFTEKYYSLSLMQLKLFWASRVFLISGIYKMLDMAVWNCASSIPLKWKYNSKALQSTYHYPFPLAGNLCMCSCLRLSSNVFSKCYHPC